MNLYRKTIYVWAVVSNCLFFSCSADGRLQDLGNDKQLATNAPVREVTPHSLPSEFYMRLEGEIAGQPVVMNLQRDRTEIWGNYYYQGSWLTLSQMEASVEGTFVFSETGFDMNQQENFIHLEWTGLGFVGKWVDGLGAKSRPLVLRESYPEGSYHFKQSLYRDSLMAPASDGGKKVVDFQEQYVAVNGAGKDHLWLDRSLKSRDGLDGTMSWGHEIRKKSKERLGILMGNQLKAREIDSTGISTGYFDRSKNTILYNGKSYLVLAMGHSLYTGGLHPNYGTNMVCYDVRNKKLMQLKDVLKPGVNLCRVLEKHFRQQYGLNREQSLDGILFEEEIYENRNFYFNDKGLAFRYNTYEIAPYGEGEISIFLPFSEIKDLLQPAFRDRIGS